MEEDKRLLGRITAGVCHRCPICGGEVSIGSNEPPTSRRSTHNYCFSCRYMFVTEDGCRVSEMILKDMSTTANPLWDEWKVLPKNVLVVVKKFEKEEE